jgi:hypothetical protein
MRGNDYPAAFPAAQWVPCGQVTACGVPPQTTSFVQNASTGEQKYKNHYATPYPGMPSDDGLWGCDIKIDVATIDPGGNFSLLSARPGKIPGQMASTTGYYFQPAECWACYKKKSSLFAIALGIIAIATVVFAYAGIAAVVACAAGGGGLCTPKHTKFLGNECWNRYGSGKTFCTKVKTNYPAWFGSTVATTTCPAQGPIPYPGNPKMFYSLEQREVGESYEDEAQYDAATGSFCHAEALCQATGKGSAQWVGFPDENDNPTPIAECGKYYTAHKIDISGTPQNTQPPTSGAPVCRFYVPDQYVSRVGWVASNYYSSFVKCPTGISPYGNVLCSYYYDKKGKLHVSYPSDAMTGANPNVNVNNYFYFNYDAPPNLSLPECS